MSERRRLAFVGLSHRANSRSFGGAAVVIANLANELVARDVSMGVVVFAHRDLTEPSLAFDSRVNLHYLRGHSREVLFIQIVGYLVRMRVGYNPIVEPGLAARFKEPAAHPWPKDARSPVILGVGRLTAQKDFATLVSAFALVRRQRPCRLLIFGEGERRGRHEALAAMLGVTDALDFSGFQPTPLPVTREARLLVMSSGWEGFDNVLAAARYCGISVASTDCPNGLREVLANGEFGRMVPVGDPRALADAIVETLDEEPDPNRLRKRAEGFSAASSDDGYRDGVGMPLE